MKMKIFYSMAICSALSPYAFSSEVSLHPSALELKACYKSLLSIPSEVLVLVIPSDSCLKSIRGRELYLQGDYYNSSSDAGLTSLVKEYGRSKEVVLMLEGSSEDRPYFRGLADPSNQEHYTEMYTFTQNGSDLIKSALHSTSPSKVLDPIVEKLIKSLSVFKSNWSQINRPFKDKTQEEMAIGIDRLFGSPADADHLSSQVITKGPEAFIEVLKVFTSEVEKELMKLDQYKGYRPEDFRSRSLGAVRELDWLHRIKDVLCRDDQPVKPLWIKVGIGHKKYLECGLKALLGDAVTLKRVSSGRDVRELTEKWQKVLLPDEKKEKLRGIIQKDIKSKGHNVKDYEISIGNREQGDLSNYLELKVESNSGTYNVLKRESLKRKLDQLLKKEGLMLDHKTLLIRPVSFKKLTSPELN